MDILKSIIDSCFSIFNLPFTIMSFDITLWMVFLAVAIIALVAKLIWGILQ